MIKFNLIIVLGVLFFLTQVYYSSDILKWLIQEKDRTSILLFKAFQIIVISGYGYLVLKETPRQDE